jgi:hypothetical protein
VRTRVGAGCEDGRVTTAPATRFDLFTVPPAAVPRAIGHMATDRWHLRREAPVFWKLLGTGDGRTFDARDADLRRWAVLTVWPSEAAARTFGSSSPVVRGWRDLADEHWWAHLHTLRATGAWSRRSPFGAAASHRNEGGTSVRGMPASGPIAAVTRARLRWSRAPRFWRSVAPVNEQLAAATGLRLRLGIGEAPLGLQGTFTLWDSASAMQAFAYRDAAHRDVIARSSAERWYAEELFARFAVTACGGTVFGADPLR